MGAEGRRTARHTYRPRSNLPACSVPSGPTTAARAPWRAVTRRGIGVPDWRSRSCATDARAPSAVSARRASNGSSIGMSAAMASRCSRRMPVDWMSMPGASALSIRTADGSGDPWWGTSATSIVPARCATRSVTASQPWPERSPQSSARAGVPDGDIASTMMARLCALADARRAPFLTEGAAASSGPGDRGGHRT